MTRLDVLKIVAGIFRDTYFRQMNITAKPKIVFVRTKRKNVQDRASYDSSTGIIYLKLPALFRKRAIPSNFRLSKKYRWVADL